MAETKDPVDRLYDLPLDEFISARDGVAADLQERGDREASARVKKLRRPTVTAWAVNQLVRRHRREVQALVAMGDEVRAALSAGGTQKIREITERRRAAVARLLGHAEEILSEAGHGTARTSLDKIGDTLVAATVEAEAADAVRSGRLERELAARSGFEAMAGISIATESPTKTERRARERAAKAEHEARAAEDDAKAAEKEAHRLENEAERVRREAQTARRKADRASERARELRRKADET